VGDVRVAHVAGDALHWLVGFEDERSCMFQALVEQECIYGFVEDRLLEHYRDRYSASDDPEEVTFGPVRGLAVSGQGEPGGAEYMKALNPLLAVAHETLNLAAKSNRPFFDASARGSLVGRG
jgi:hypothetical protein